MKDDLGDRMKDQYEDRTRYLLPRRTYTIIRIDGKAFHTYTKGLEKPFDRALSTHLDMTTIKVMHEIQGAQFAFVQSDEISILVTDFAEPTTCAWFDGNVQKIVSVVASLFTAEFNRLRMGHFFKVPLNDPDFNKPLNRSLVEIGGDYCKDIANFKLAAFDARVFTIPDPWEVYNYFVWRNKDSHRNAVSSAAQVIFGHKQLQNKSTVQKKQMLLEAEAEPISPYNMYGRLISKGIIIPAWEFTKIPAGLQTLIPNFPSVEKSLEQIIEESKAAAERIISQTTAYTSKLSEQDLAETTHN